MIYLAFLWVAVWLAHAKIAPTKTGKGNRSNPGWITRAQKPVSHDGNVTAFAFVQERGEFRLYKILAAAIGAAAIGVAIAFDLDAVSLIIGAPVALVVIEALVRMLSSIDIAGHGAEIMAAELAMMPDEADAYRLREAESVARQYEIGADEALIWLDESRWLAGVVYWLGSRA